MLTPRPGAMLVPGDVSSHGVHAAWRAALVARELECTLRLLHAEVGADDPHGTGKSLRKLASDLRGHIGVAVELVEDARDALAATVRGARDAALVVIGSRRGNPLREWVLGKRRRGLLADFFLGGVTQRVLAAAESDVLVVPPERAGEAPGTGCALAPFSAGVRALRGSPPAYDNARQLTAQGNALRGQSLTYGHEARSDSPRLHWTGR